MQKSLTKKFAGDIEDTLEDVVDHLRAVAETRGEEAHEALSRAAASVGQAAQSLAAQARSQSRVLANRSVQQVREHPAAATALAVAVVALAGYLIVRRWPSS
jgi:ElaB/YqjD/DUF883 family membrane-anchored ribosome-binding protein